MLKKNTRQCLSWASWFMIIDNVTYSIDYGLILPGFQRKIKDMQINVATNFYSKVCEMMLRCASGGVSVVCKCGQ